MRDDFYKRKGYKPEKDDATYNALASVGKAVARRHKIRVYTDHYLNKITYHYTQYMPSGMTALTGVSETGYVWQKRTMLEKEIEGNLPPELGNFLNTLKKAMDTKRHKINAELKQAEEKNRKDEAKKLDELMKVPTIKLAYNELEIANSKLIATAEKMEQLSKSGNYSHSKLNTFLQNTQNEIEMSKLKTEYNKVARECLLKLTQFRLNVQDWSAKNPQYAKVANWTLHKVKDGAMYVVVAGIIASCYATAPISVPVAIAGTGVAIGTTLSIDYAIEHYVRAPLVAYATKQGTTLAERTKFKETANWLITGVQQGKNTITILNPKNYTKIFTPKYSKTYIHKIDKHIEIAGILRNATQAYTKSQKERLLEEVTRLFING